MPSMLKHRILHIFFMTYFNKVLQQFHKTSIRKGSPLKMAKFTMPSIKKQIRYDPRPTKFRECESTQASFKNQCINFQASGELIQNNTCVLFICILFSSSENDTFSIYN